MVIVTHEMNFAFKVSDRIVFMEKGRVVCDDTPQACVAGNTRGSRPFSKMFLWLNYRNVKRKNYDCAVAN